MDNRHGAVETRPLETTQSPRHNGGAAKERDRGASVRGWEGNGATSSFSVPASKGFDPTPLAASAIKRWPWMAGAAALALAFGLLLGFLIFSTHYIAEAKLVLYRSTVGEEFALSRHATSQSLAGFLEAPELFRRTSLQAAPRVSPGGLMRRIQILPERNGEMVAIRVSGFDPRITVDLANLFSREAVRFSREMQANDAAEARRYLEQQVNLIQEEITTLQDRLPVWPAGLSSEQDSVANWRRRLEGAQEYLTELLLTYTPAHPKVQEQQSRVEVLKDQIERLAPAGLESNPGADAVNGFETRAAAGEDAGLLSPKLNLDIERLKNLEQRRTDLENRLRSSRIIQRDPAGYFRLFKEASLEGLAVRDKGMKVLFLGLFCGMLGLAVTGGGFIAAEVFDDRIKTSSDVRRAAGLPVLASMPDDSDSHSRHPELWAHALWGRLANQLDASEKGKVIGITSSRPGEGGGSVVDLLGGAACWSGCQTLKLTIRLSANGSKRGNGSSDLDRDELTGPRPFGKIRRTALWRRLSRSNRVPESRRAPVSRPREPVPNGTPEAKTEIGLDEVLEHPARIFDNAAPLGDQGLLGVIVTIDEWTPDKARQWRSAVRQWQRRANRAVVIELPSSDRHETLFLAQPIPCLIWLANADVAKVSETRDRLGWMRKAGCRFAGAVIHRDQTPRCLKALSRWTVSATAALVLMSSVTLPAQDAGLSEAAPENPQETFSVLGPEQRAEWQKKLTLGPGDVLTFSILGEPELRRDEVFIRPDGRVSYLEAQDIMAEGLSVDELRERIRNELAQYRRAHFVVVSPVEFRSKKYFLLGQVAQKGVFTLNRPMTVIEAVARAQGFQTGYQGGDIVETVDLSRSFLMRQGRHVDVNFERLFREGDLSENVALEPGDYLYFPALAVKEIYVLGEINFPGRTAYQSGMTVLSAIAANGGFTEGAWKKKVLVVSGSLQQPEARVVSVKDILDGKAKDEPLLANEIVYVSHNPWSDVRDVLDVAVRAFVQSAVVTWTGLNVGPFIE